ncbi:hypothetical protein DPEC_G00314210 [Dallia pectoralis]|uniref:Uncharacterized protein n=1 Tax=Dallia pectoralis TaxID=75939 RepID=A0ACC2FCB9_DALPE|nr:hypothetical protein DPEC_G00314210 [Dallia pectoralis]
MIRSMLLNGRATLAKADAMGLSVLLVFTVIVRKSMLQHILLNNEHCVLYHHATKVAYTACKRVRKVLSGTLDKVNIEMGHKRNLLFLSSLKPKETVRHYRKGQTKAKVVTGNYRTFTESVMVKDVERMNKHWMPMYNLYQPCAVSNDFIGSYEYLGSDANYVLRHTGAPLNVHFPERQTWEQTDVGILGAVRSGEHKDVSSDPPYCSTWAAARFPSAAKWSAPPRL